MLSKGNRVVKAADFRSTVRSGRRIGTAHTIVYVAARGIHEPTRFGFITAKNVGGAVTRNLVRRRMRAIGLELLDSMATGSDVVVRALPGSDQVAWTTLQGEIAEAVDRGVARR